MLSAGRPARPSRACRGGAKASHPDGLRELPRGAEAGRRVLVVLGSHNEVFEKSARNIPEVRVILAGNLSVRDLLAAETVFMTRDAIEHVEQAWA